MSQEIRSSAPVFCTDLNDSYEVIAYTAAFKLIFKYYYETRLYHSSMEVIRLTSLTITASELNFFSKGLNYRCELFSIKIRNKISRRSIPKRVLVKLRDNFSRVISGRGEIISRLINFRQFALSSRDVPFPATVIPSLPSTGRRRDKREIVPRVRTMCLENNSIFRSPDVWDRFAITSILPVSADRE